MIYKHYWTKPADPPPIHRADLSDLLLNEESHWGTDADEGDLLADIENVREAEILWAEKANPTRQPWSAAFFRSQFRLILIVAVTVICTMGLGALILYPMVKAPPTLFYDPAFPVSPQFTQTVEAKPQRMKLDDAITPEVRQRIGRIVAVADEIILRDARNIGYP